VPRNSILCPNQSSCHAACITHSSTHKPSTRFDQEALDFSAPSASMLMYVCMMKHEGPGAGRYRLGTTYKNILSSQGSSPQPPFYPSLNCVLLYKHEPWSLPPSPPSYHLGSLLTSVNVTPPRNTTSTFSTLPGPPPPAADAADELLLPAPTPPAAAAGPPPAAAALVLVEVPGGKQQQRQHQHHQPQITCCTHNKPTSNKTLARWHIIASEPVLQY
jgi:hypothetical protein